MSTFSYSHSRPKDYQGELKLQLVQLARTMILFICNQLNIWAAVQCSHHVSKICPLQCFEVMLQALLVITTNQQKIKDNLVPNSLYSCLTKS